MKVGFITCVHPFYDLPAVHEHRDRAIAGLTAAGCEVLPTATPRSAGEAAAIARDLKNSGADLVVLFFCTWVAEEVPLAVAGELGDLPLLLWSLPFLDRDVPMPSPISGLTASASNIRRLGKPFVHLVGGVTPERIAEAVRGARVAKVVRGLRAARLGIVGSPCPGMLDVAADDAEIREVFGATAVHLELEALLQAAAEAWIDEAADLGRRLLARVAGIKGTSEQQVTDSFRMYLGMRRLVEQHRLDAYCVRCWPELRNEHATTVCLAHSQMSEAGIPNVCEVDVPALITTFVLSRLAGAPAYCFDVTGFLEPENAIQFAHCGSAGLSLAAEPERAWLRSHMRTGTGAVLEFGFKPGAVTLAKVMRPVGGRWKVFAATGRVVPTEGVRGSVATVEPQPSAAAFLEAMLREGVEHHIVLVYGDLARELDWFCRWLNLELVRA